MPVYTVQFFFEPQDAGVGRGASPGGKLFPSCGQETIINTAQLDIIFGKKGVILCSSLRYGRSVFVYVIKRQTIGALLGDGARDADDAANVQFIGVIQNTGFNARVSSRAAEAMGGDAGAHLLGLCFSPTDG